MKRFVELLLFALAIGLAGCGSPKPPGWPAGEERPINPSQSEKTAR
jgi:hypothetical protein